MAMRKQGFSPCLDAGYEATDFLQDSPSMKAHSCGILVMNPILCPEKEFWAWFSVPNADAYDGLSPTDPAQPHFLWGL